MQTFEEFQALASSEKIILSQVEAGKRLMGWEIVSGSIYSVAYDKPTILSLEENGDILISVDDFISISAGSYFLDRFNKILYVQTSDSVNPNNHFMAVFFTLFFSNIPVRIPYDLSTGFDVEWLPYIKDTSEFGFELDNQDQLGVAIEGSGQIRFSNEQSFWKPIYDKLYFENQKVFIYSWNRLLPISEAKLIYRGRIEAKTYTSTEVSFKLKDVINELKQVISLNKLSDIVGARIPDALSDALQRRIYGYVYNHVLVSLDQILDSYPLIGTLSLVNGSATVTGSGTSFLNDLSVDDQINIEGFEEDFNVKSIASNTSLDLNDVFESPDISGLSFSVKPSHAKKYANRDFFIAGHSLREPTSTIVSVTNLSTIEVSSTDDLLPGDPIYILGENSTIRRISGNTVKLTTNLVNIPDIGTVVSRPAITNLRLRNRTFILGRDYTIDAVTGRLQLEELAEFNVSPIQALSGLLNFTNTSRSVTGTSTQFKTEIKTGDWIRQEGQFDFFEVLEVIDDLSLTLRTASSYTSVTQPGQIKSPEIYDNENELHVLICDALGKTDDGLTTGSLIKKGPQIIQDLVIEAGLLDILNTSSIDTANSLTDARLGLVIPQTFDSKATTKIRDVIDKVNISIFGSLYQNNDFQIEYSLIDPSRPRTILQLKEDDILKFIIKSESKNISNIVTVSYMFEEYDISANMASYPSVLSTSDNVTFLAKTEKQFDVETILVDIEDANRFTKRWGLIKEVASSAIQFDSKLQVARTQINEKIDISHEKFYERIGSTDSRKIAAVQLAKKDGFGATIELEDLANTFSRCGVITENDAAAFEDSDSDDRFFNGYITDDFGMIDNDSETFGVNLIY